jgi:hypothetical protein
MHDSSTGRARGRVGGVRRRARRSRSRPVRSRGRPRDDHGERQRRHANGHPDRESSAAHGHADRDRDRPGRRAHHLEPGPHQRHVGSTGSASFAIGTSITLSATNSRDVLWSGACSSGGNKTKTCTFTLNANAAVTANVQCDPDPGTALQGRRGLATTTRRRASRDCATRASTTRVHGASGLPGDRRSPRAGDSGYECSRSVASRLES